MTMRFLDIFDRMKNRFQIAQKSPRYFLVDAGHRVPRPNVRAVNLDYRVERDVFKVFTTVVDRRFL